MYSWKQFTGLPGVRDLSSDEQQRRYYRYKNLMMEASSTSPSSAAASSAAAGAGAGGGGSIRNVMGSAAIYFSMNNGVFTYSITNFDKGTTTPLTTLNYTSDMTVQTSFPSQDGGFLIWYSSNTDAIDYLLYIDVNGKINEIKLDYELDLNSYWIEGKYHLIYYLSGGKTNFKLFDGNGLREFTISEEVDNITGWGWSDIYDGGFVIATVNGNSGKVWAINDKSTKPVLITTVDLTTYYYNVYMHDSDDYIAIRYENHTLNSTIDYIKFFSKNGQELLEIDCRSFVVAPYTIQNGDTKESLASDFSCTVERLVLINPNYDMDNLVEGETINSFTPLYWSNTQFMNTSNNMLITFQNNGYGLSPGMRRVVLFNKETASYTTQTFSLDFEMSLYHNATNWDSTNDYIDKSLVYIFWSSNYTSVNDFYYPNSIYLLPVFPQDTTLRTPILLASQSNASAADYRKVGFLQQTPILQNDDSILIMIDENRLGPGLFHFTDFNDGAPNQIEDGGNDMYDGGNIIAADYNTIEYTHTQMESDFDVFNLEMGASVAYFPMNGTVSTNATLGPSASYFTNLYPGIFTMVAKDINIGTFSISGYTGHDSTGETYSNHFQVTSNANNVYQVFVKALHHETPEEGLEPSINQIFIVNAATSSGLTHLIDPDTDIDANILSGLSGNATEIHYLLTSQSWDKRLTDQEFVDLSTRYINMVDGMTIEETRAVMNINYSYITDVLDCSSVRYSYYKINSDNTQESSLSRVFKSENVDWPWRSKEFSVVRSRQELETIGNVGYNNLPDVQGRSWNHFTAALNYQVGSNATSTDLVMWSVKSNNYYKIDITQWTQGGAGGFAYTRQLITEAMDEPIIAFTHSNGTYFNSVDVIEPGILEISRGNGGPLVNLAQQTDWWNEGPAGTLWNSVFSGEYLHKFITLKHDMTKYTETMKIEPKLSQNSSAIAYCSDPYYGRTIYTTGEMWNEIVEETYGDDWGSEQYISDELYSQSTTILVDKKTATARILHIGGSGTFSLAVNEDSNGFIFYQARANNEVVATLHETDTAAYLTYRNLEGTIIDYVTFDDFPDNYYSFIHVKNRYFFVYQNSEDRRKVFVFDGSKITLVVNEDNSDSTYEMMYNDKID